MRSPNVSVVVSAVTWSVVEETRTILSVCRWTNDRTGWYTPSKSVGKRRRFLVILLLIRHGNVQCASATGIETADTSAFVVVVVLMGRRRQDFRIDQ